MKRLAEYLVEASKAKGTVYEYEEAKDTDNPSKFKDRIQLVGYEGKWMRETYGPIYIKTVTKSKDQFLADCLATIKDYNSNAKWCEILAYDQDENDFVTFATAGQGKQCMWHPEYIGSNPEFHEVFK